MGIKKSTQQGKEKRVLGIWNLNVSPISLGGLLILAEELQIQRIIHGADCADICIIGDTVNLKPILSALLDIEGINTCFFYRTIVELQNLLSARAYITWPILTERGTMDHRYGTTMYVQKFYREEGFIPHLSCKDGALRWAMNFIAKYVIPHLPVVVHLKNNPNDQYGNADFDSWLTFFNACYRNQDVTFILIGNEEIDQEICRLPNVVVARDLGSDLSRDLALIQIAFIFMGMMSGPCNMALFNNIPYIIYKTPAYHAEEMKRELNASGQFPFAIPFQKVLRIFETSDNLISEFTCLYDRLNHQNWEKQFTDLLPVYTNDR